MLTSNSESDISYINKIERVSLGVTIVLFGMFLTFFTGSLSPPDGIINPFWGSLFGLGFWLEYTLFESLPTGILGLAWGLFGVIIWPATVVLSFQKVLKVVQSNRLRIAAYLFYGLFLISLIYNLRVVDVHDSFAADMPIFIKYLDFAPR